MGRVTIIGIVLATALVIACAWDSGPAGDGQYRAENFAGDEQLLMFVAEAFDD